MGKVHAILLLSLLSTASLAQDHAEEEGAHVQDSGQELSESAYEPVLEEEHAYTLRLEAVDESSPDYLLLVQLDSDAAQEHQATRPLIEWRSRDSHEEGINFELRSIGPGLWGEKLQGPIPDGNYELRLILLQSDSDGEATQLRETQYELSLPGMEIETLATRVLELAETSGAGQEPAEPENGQLEAPGGAKIGGWIAAGAGGMFVFLFLVAGSGYYLRRRKKAGRDGAMASLASKAENEAAVQAVDKVLDKASAAKEEGADAAELKDLSF